MIPDFDQPLGIQTILGNPSRRKNLTIISGEFEHLNKKVIKPGQRMKVDLLIPKGYREFIKVEKIGGNDYIYVGLVDKDAAEPIIHTPNI